MKDINEYRLPENLAPYARTGNLLVNAKPKIGPHVEASIISVIPRDMFMGIIEQIKEIKPSKRLRVVGSISTAVRNAVLNPMDPSQNQDLMEDLPLLCAFNLFLKDAKIISDSGLFMIALMIDMNPAFTWEQRGMLDPDLLKRLEVNDEPFVVL